VDGPKRVSTAVAALLLVVGVITVIPSPAGATTTIVVTSGGSIQAAIDAASTGDVVSVAPGVYHESINFDGKAIEVRGSGDDQTSIEGDGTQPVVTFATGEGSASELDGFAISGGYGPNGGGGVYMDGTSPKIEDDVISANTGLSGGGVFSSHGSPEIEHDQIVANRDTSGGGFGGGGIGLFGSSASVVDDAIVGNSSADSGGGISVWSADDPVITGNQIYGNSAPVGQGGAIATVNDFDTLINGNLLYGNGDPEVALSVPSGSLGSQLVNNTIMSFTGPAIAFQGFNASEEVANNVITGTSSPVVTCDTTYGDVPPAFDHNDVYTPVSGGPYSNCGTPATNISVDPEFVSTTTSQPNYRVDWGSPVIDAGDDAAANMPATDLAGDPRVQDGNADGVATVDMGAYEGAAGLWFHPVTPFRALDSRTPVGGWAGSPIGAGETRPVTLAGVGGVPLGAAAVVANVTVTDATVSSYLTIYPAGSSTRPTTSNLNFEPGESVAHTDQLVLSGDGKVDVYNQNGSADVVIDIVGYYDAGATSGPTRFHSVTPTRLLDSRTTTGGWSGPLGPGETENLTVTGGAVPSGAAAVVLNVTATDPTEASYLQVFPAGGTRPVTSSVNDAAGQTVANLVTCAVSADGQISIYNNSGNSDVVVDVLGYFDTTSSGSLYHPVWPDRVLDSRVPLGTGGPLSGGITTNVAIAGVGSVLPNATAVAMNVTAVNILVPSFLTVWPSGLPRPTSSNLNLGTRPGFVSATEAVPNLVMVAPGTDGDISFYDLVGTINVVGDVEGYYLPT
jgi:hypothetical protein